MRVIRRFCRICKNDYARKRSECGVDRFIESQNMAHIMPYIDALERGESDVCILTGLSVWT